MSNLLAHFLRAASLYKVLVEGPMPKPLLGTILIESQICKPDHVELALRRQRELAERNHYKHLGAILLEMGLVSLTQLHRALEWQKLASREAEASG